MTHKSHTYFDARMLEFRRIFRAQFFAYLYGSYFAELSYDDFAKMYDMGGEL